MSTPTKQDAVELLNIFDPEMASLLHREEKRQFETIGLIASENVVSPLVSCLEGSVFTNKNTEGYPGKRFVGGCQLADQAELLALERVKKVFGAEHANIQSGNATIANMAVLYGLLNRGDTFLGMTLDNGGHLSHGAKFHFSGKEFNALHYGVSRETERIDMDQVRQMAREHRPRLIVTGASSYPRMIDYQAFREICDEVGAYFWVDCAHDCGLIAGGAIPSPVPYADVVTMSTQKTLRGPRGCGVILCREELGTKIDRAVFPRLQGGPKGDMLAARGVLFVTPVIESGLEAETLLCSLGIITNKNMIPYDQLPPSTGSGLRIGSPTMTTRGAKEEEMNHIGHLLGRALNHKDDTAVLDKIRAEVKEIATSHPMFSSEWVSPSIRKVFEEMYGHVEFG